MKISDIVKADFEQVKKMSRFDYKKMPIKQRIFLRPIVWLLSKPEVNACHVKINKVNMEGLKPPYILLGNHNSFVDFKVATKAIFPRPASYVVAVDGFINREWLLRNVGGIPKRKFISDISLARKLRYDLEKNKNIAIIYPEARYSHVGTKSVLPKSLAKMIKIFKVPVVTLICHGDHLRQPVWNLKKRKLDLCADMTQVVTQEEIKTLSVDEIFDRINNAFYYDDYEWQKQNNIHITEPFRAEGLHLVLYKCPHCMTESQMSTSGTKIKCEKCGKEYEMDELGELHALDGETEFSHIPAWYEWQREMVKKEILSGEYSLDLEVYIDSLPNSTGFYRLGRGNLHHDKNGFVVTAKLGDTDFVFKKNVADNYSVHVEYQYFGKGDCVSLSTTNDTYYFFPTTQKNIVTKIAFAVEELYNLWAAEKEE